MVVRPLPAPVGRTQGGTRVAIGEPLQARRILAPSASRGAQGIWMVSGNRVDGGAGRQRTPAREHMELVPLDAGTGSHASVEVVSRAELSAIRGGKIVADPTPCFHETHYGESRSG